MTLEEALKVLRDRAITCNIYGYWSVPVWDGLICERMVFDDPIDAAEFALESEVGAADWRGDPDYAYKFYLQKLKMVDGCYTLDGTYWGLPANLYCAWCPNDGTPIRMFVRASSHAEAKQKVLDEYPNARFFR